MAVTKWIHDLTAITPAEDAARRVIALRFEPVRDFLGLALREPDKDPEFVHQLRVGTRRAGAALDIFSLCLPDKVYKIARQELKRIRRAAGEVRDWDVFLETLSQEVALRPARHRATGDFLLGFAMGHRIDAQHHLAQASFDYPFAFERLTADTLHSIQPSPHGERTLLDLACPILFSMLRDLDQAVARDLLNYHNLHQVRITGKRLRYAMEIFADCFAPAFREKLYPAVEEMQEILGRANDSFIAGRHFQTLCDKLEFLPAPEKKRLKPGLKRLLEFHQDRLPRERESFEDWWRNWQKEGGEVAFTSLLKNPVVISTPPTNGSKDKPQPARKTRTSQPRPPSPRTRRKPTA